MLLLDFYSGSHGHFLEYVINTYIFKGPRVDQIFTNLGTSHGIRKNSNYMSNRIIRANHFTEFDIETTKPQQVVRILVNSLKEVSVYQINVMTRAGDIPLEKKIKDIPADLRQDSASLRNNLFSKLNAEGYATPKNWRWNDVPYYEFPMNSLYDLQDFYCELLSLSKFLNHSFSPDVSLTQLWHEFVDKNQGLQYWNQAQNLLHKVLANENFLFDSDAWTQALLNQLLSKTVGIFDGPLYHNSTYPNNTQQIYQLLQQHVLEYDCKF